MQPTSSISDSSARIACETKSQLALMMTISGPVVGSGGQLCATTFMSTFRTCASGLYPCRSRWVEGQSLWAVRSRATMIFVISG